MGSGQSNIFGAPEENSTRRFTPLTAHQQSCETDFCNPHGGASSAVNQIGTRKLRAAVSPNLHSPYTGIAENAICG
jgi:hypothetical protein